MKSGIIAVIDDDELDRNICKKIVLLTCPSYRLIDFTNGLDALEYLGRHASDPLSLPDILIFDIRMPFLNGWQYLERYCEIKPNLAKATRHYVCSASIDPFDMEFKNSNLYGYIVKPLGPKEMEKIITYSES